MDMKSAARDSKIEQRNSKFKQVLCHAYHCHCSSWEWLNMIKTCDDDDNCKKLGKTKLGGSKIIS